uniref:Tetratricopeptide repeat protein 39B n=1 Tax=Denticeps clupeoides TaxID=299321 RepID=A0AAY4AV61_9TELE
DFGIISSLLVFQKDFEEAFDSSPVQTKVDLVTALEDCYGALSLFLNNKFSEALGILRPWRNESMYHAMGYSSILVMQAAMTFEPRDMHAAMTALNEALQTCQRFRRRTTLTKSISNLLYKQAEENLTEVEMHADLCYAEVLLQNAALTFLEDESLIGFIRGGIRIRSSYQIFKQCQAILNSNQDLAKESETLVHFAGGVHMGIGSFNLMLSLLPSKVLRLLEFIGFSGNRELGLSYLRQGAASSNLRAILSTITLLMYHLYVTVILGSGDGNLAEAELLLDPYIKLFPNGCLMIFYTARIAALKGDFELSQQMFLECITAQQEWHQIHHLCYWELMWSYCFLQDWKEAYRYADLLSKESKWSQAIYVFQKASVLCMMSEEEQKDTGENVIELFRQVEGLRLKFAGKSVPSEKFAVRKARRYNAPNPVKLVIPLEMMYMWNGFHLVGKRPDLTVNFLVTIEKAEEQLRNDPKPSEYHTDDRCLVQMLKGVCLKHLGRLQQAEKCYAEVISSEKNIKYDHYLVPFTLYELGLLCKQQGDTEKAIAHIENAKLNYKGYSMESRLNFRIHAAQSALAATTPLS